MTPDALRAAIASAREHPRMYGDDPDDLESYFHGLVAGAYDGDADAPRAAWARHRAPPLHHGGYVYADATADSVCDHALRVVAALWSQFATPVLTLDAIGGDALAPPPTGCAADLTDSRAILVARQRSAADAELDANIRALMRGILDVCRRARIDDDPEAAALMQRAAEFIDTGATS